ncbi:MAG: phosphopantothenoylcysteine decarboxylase, partial [Microcystis sp. LE19-196.1B]|nr:phosphopantothenoylcysteine decarboxylase [Microcystis sp. LE19-196.1B]
PAYLPHEIIETYDEYLGKVMGELESKDYKFGIFSAAVADYRLEKPFSGKIPSGGQLNLNFVPTEKVIDKVREKFPDLEMLTFKYQEGVSQEELLEIARKRLEKGYQAVIANRGEEKGDHGEQVAYLVTKAALRKFIGKKAIAIAIAEYLEERAKNVTIEKI